MATAAAVIAILALILAVTGLIVGFNAYRRGVEAGRAQERDRLAIEPPKPYVCPHPWEPWGKAKWNFSTEGWIRVQRRVCGLCGEEQERRSA